MQRGDRDQLPGVAAVADEPRDVGVRVHLFYSRVLVQLPFTELPPRGPVGENLMVVSTRINSSAARLREWRISQDLTSMRPSEGDEIEVASEHSACPREREQRLAEQAQRVVCNAAGLHD